MMHEYHHHFVEYGSPTTNPRLVNTNSFQTSFVGSTVGPLVRPPPPIPPSNTQTIPPLAYTEVKLEPQTVFLRISAMKLQQNPTSVTSVDTHQP